MQCYTTVLLLARRALGGRKKTFSPNISSLSTFSDLTKRKIPFNSLLIKIVLCTISGLPSTTDPTVVGVYPGLYVNEMNYFSDIIHDVWATSQYALQVHRTTAAAPEFVIRVSELSGDNLSPASSNKPRL